MKPQCDYGFLILALLDLRNMGVKRWRLRALDRTEWTSIMRAAKARFKGL
jgi:hypothetical protein